MRPRLRGANGECGSRRSGFHRAPPWRARPPEASHGLRRLHLPLNEKGGVVGALVREHRHVLRRRRRVIDGFVFRR